MRTSLTTEIETRFKKGFLQNLQDIINSFNRATNEAIILGCEKDSQRTDFLLSVAFKHLPDLQVGSPVSDEIIVNDVYLPSSDPVTVRHSLIVNFSSGEIGKFTDQKKTQGVADMTARKVIYNMFGIGVSCLYNFLKNIDKRIVFDRSSIKPGELHLKDERYNKFTPPNAWLLHSSHYFSLLKEQQAIFLKQPAFSFGAGLGGVVTDLFDQVLIIRDKDFLKDSILGKIDKYSIVGMYKGAVTVFLDNLKVEIEGDVCRFFWDQSTAIKGFAPADNGSNSLSPSLYSTENWRLTARSEKEMAGFIHSIGIISN